jgi:hypothetical protein
MKLLVEAHVVKFEAPVVELKPFYFYKIIFPTQGDTFSIYHYGQAFTVELATILKDYKLLDGNKINRTSYVKFRRDYRNNRSLATKMHEFIVYLNESRFFNEQVIRDRRKPVTIVKDRIIIQDGKRIGTLVKGSELAGGNIQYLNGRTVNHEQTPSNIVIQKTTNESYMQVMLPTSRIVDASKINLGPKEQRPKLFEISVPVNKEASNEQLLLNLCKLIENYLL